MTGFHLPKFRWLLIGAMAAGGWAMTQEPPKREHWQHQQDVETGGPAKTAVADKTTMAAVQRASAPPEMTTSSIPKPQASLASRSGVSDTRTDDDAASASPKKPAKTVLRTSEKVRMREDATTSSAVVTMLKGGQAVEVLAVKGAWKQVSSGGQTGWVREDYLVRNDAVPDIQAEIPRPKVDIGSIISEETKTVSAGPAPMSEWDAMRPSRPPQGGDCQCPYDLMLNGKQCGGRSAYAQGRAAACYF